jgi:hypothetical protein
MVEKPRKTVVSGEDLAIGIQFTTQFSGNRQLSFSTACPQDIHDTDLAVLLRRLSTAADALDATYQLRALRAEMDYFERELATSRQQQENYEFAAATEFSARGRQGPLVLGASQEAAIKNYKTTQESLAGKILKLREQIADMEKLVEVG